MIKALEYKLFNLLFKPVINNSFVWFSAIEIGIIEGSLAGKVGLNAPIVDIGT